MKNDPSMLGVSEHERRERDFYPTPEDATKVIFDTATELELVPENMTVWEPACGDGAMSNVLATKFKKVINSDIVPLMENAYKANFYTEEPKEHVDWIITNPPYGEEADKFIERMLYFVQDHKCYASILARNELDCAKGRNKFFGASPLFREKRILLWRPRWIADSTGSPRHNYAWYTWAPFDRNLCYKPLIRYSHRRD
jgi:hypothetical protein